MKDKNLLSEVLRGYSIIESQKWGSCYLKHLTIFDVAQVDILHESFYAEAKEAGLQTIEEKEKWLIEEGLWSEEKNQQIKDIISFIDGLKNTKAKSFREIEIKALDRKIKDQEKKLNELNYEKHNLLDITVESVCTRKINEHYLIISLFKDPAFNTPLITQDIFDNEITDDDLEDLLRMYHGKTSLFNEKNLKKMAISGHFFNLFNICNDNSFNFYGKPVVQLTFHQVELFSFGLLFKSIFSNTEGKPPPDVAEDPDKLIEWAQSKRNFDETTKTKNVAPENMFDLSAEDREKFGVKENTFLNKLVEKAQKKGGSLEMRDIVETRS